MSRPRADDHDAASIALAALAAAPAPQPPPPSATLAAELAALAPVSARSPSRQIAILVGISLVYGAGLVATLTVRRDLRELPAGWLVATAALWLVGLVVPSYLALVPRAGSVMPRSRLAVASAVTTAFAFIALGLAVHPSGPSSVHHGWDQLARGHTCLEIGLASALVPVIAGAVFLRGALPVGAHSVAAALGAGGGCLGGLVLHLHCHVADGLHVGVVHGGVVVAAALLAAALVPGATEQRVRR
jgi:hypothetical protein